MTTVDPSHLHRIYLQQSAGLWNGLVRRALEGWFVCGLAVICLASGGCGRPPQHRLLGHWIGHPTGAIGGATRSDQGTDRPLSVEFELEFIDSRQFAMTLRDSQGRRDRRSGRYRVTRIYGPRWDVQLTATDPDSTVTLELVFDGEDRMTVRDVSGDSRLNQFTFERSTGTPGSGAATSAPAAGPTPSSSAVVGSLASH